jgi:uncharacterized membrane protein
MLWGILAFAVLLSGYLLCRYVFFGTHGMKDWPTVLFVLGSAVIVVAALTNSRKVMACTVAGYLLGFAAGMLFHTHGTDLGGGDTNNAWIIWTVMYLCVICAGVIVDVMGKRKRN